MILGAFASMAARGRRKPSLIPPASPSEGNAGPFTPSPAAALTTLDLAAGGAGTRPWALAHVFAEGDLPSGQALDGIQTTVKNTWPDGSAKIAVLAGVTAFGGTAAALDVGAGTQPSGGVLTTASLKATGVTAAIGAGAFGTVSWSGTDWDSPAETWVSGPVMSSWIYRKPIGADAHLVGWLEVRLWATGAVEVLAWVENGYLLVAGPVNKSATYTFTLGGTQRYSGAINLLNHQRAVLASGTAYTHWLGTDPGVTWAHDAAYFKSTKLVPNYAATTGGSSTALTGLTTSYAPLDLADHEATMGSAGASTSISPLPEWDVAYLTSGGDVRAWRAVQVNALAAGRYGIHFRDENTNKPPRFATYPTLGLNDNASSHGITDVGSSATATPLGTGGTPPQYKTSHQPAFGYMAYLLTGRKWFVEECQFEATISHFKVADDVRAGASGYFEPSAGAVQTRAAAWSLRTLVNAATITPDAETGLQGDYRFACSENVRLFNTNYGQGNPFGVVKNYSSYSDVLPGGIDLTASTYAVGSWQEDYLTSSFGWMKDVKVLTGDDATALNGFLTWKYKSIVGRLGDGSAGTYNYRRATAYGMVVASTPTPDWTGATGWLANWQQVYDQTWQAVAALGGGDALEQGNYPSAESYWGQLHPALSYAVDHGAAGAADAYNRMVAASNYSDFLAEANGNKPQWYVTPRVSTAAPSWYTAMAVNEVKAFTGSEFGSWGGLWSGTPPGGTGTEIQAINAWSSGVLVTVGVHDGTSFRPGVWWVSARNGGHDDWAGNGVFAFGPLNGASPSWVRLRNPTIPAPSNTNRDGSGNPVSVHSYGSQQYDPVNNRIITGTGAQYLSGNSSSGLDYYDCDTNPSSGQPWSAYAGTLSMSANSGNQSISARDSAGRKTYFFFTNTNHSHMLDEATGGVTSRTNTDNPAWTDGTADMNPTTKVVVARAGNGNLYAADLRNFATFAFQAITASGTPPPSDYTSIVWDEARGAFVCWAKGAGQTMYVLTPPGDPYATTGWAWSSVSLTGATPLWSAASTGSLACFGFYNRMRKTPSPIPGFVFVTAHDRPVYFIKTAS